MFFIIFWAPPLFFFFWGGGGGVLVVKSLLMFICCCWAKTNISSSAAFFASFLRHCHAVAGNLLLRKRTLLDPSSRNVKNVFQFPLLFAHNQYYYPFVIIVPLCQTSCPLRTVHLHWYPRKVTLVTQEVNSEVDRIILRCCWNDGT